MPTKRTRRSTMPSRAFLAKRWRELCRDKDLVDLPFKIELNKWGKIEMSPASNCHALFQGEIISLLAVLAKRGRRLAECSVLTTDGVKVPDVAWASPEFLARHGATTPFDQAPEICVEVMSPSNSPGEIAEKVSLYLADGASEVWVCSETEDVTFHSMAGELSTSNLVKRFPTRIELDT